MYDKLKTFDWSELEGKTLKVVVTSDSNPYGKVTVVTGVEINTGIAYILHVEKVNYDS